MLNDKTKEKKMKKNTLENARKNSTLGGGSILSKIVDFLMGTKRHTSSSPFFAASDLPFQNDDTFSVIYSKVASSSFSNLHEDFNSRPTDKYYITISNNSIKKVTNNNCC